MYGTDERKVINKYRRINKGIQNLHSLYSILRAKTKYKIKHLFVHLNIALVSISGQFTQIFVTDFVLFSAHTVVKSIIKFMDCIFKHVQYISIYGWHADL